MPQISDVRTPIVYFDVNTGSLLLWDGSVTGAVGGGGGLTDTQLRATPVPVSATIDTTGLATSTGQTTGNNSLSSIDTKLTSQATAAKQDTGNTSVASIDTKTPALGQALAAGSTPVVLTAIQQAALTPPAAITGFATSANQTTELASLSSIDGKLTNPLPVSLPAATVTTLTPPAAITGYALDSSLVTLNAKDFATAALQSSGNTTLTAIYSVQPSTLVIDGQTVAYSADSTSRRLQEAQAIQGIITTINTIIGSESENSQRMGFELR